MLDWQQMNPDNAERKLPPRIWWLVGLLAIALAAFLFYQLGRGPAAAKEAGPTALPEVTPTLSPPYDFTIEDLAGEPVRLSDLRGQVVLVNFWATWCGPCREEMPVLQAFYDAHQKDGFTLVGVNVSESPEVAAEWIAEGGYTFPIWSDPPGDLLIELRFSGMPASIVVDEEGRIVERWLGPFDKASLDDLLLPLLSKS